MWLRRGMWLQLGDGRGSMELRVVLVDIFQPALVSSLESACGTALQILCHKHRSLEVSPNVCQRPLLVNRAAGGLCRDVWARWENAPYSVPGHGHTWSARAWVMCMRKCSN